MFVYINFCSSYLFPQQLPWFIHSVSNNPGCKAHHYGSRSLFRTGYSITSSDITGWDFQAKFRFATLDNGFDCIGSGRTFLQVLFPHRDGRRFRKCWFGNAMNHQVIWPKLSLELVHSPSQIFIFLRDYFYSLHQWLKLFFDCLTNEVNHWLFNFFAYFLYEVWQQLCLKSIGQTFNSLFVKQVVEVFILFTCFRAIGRY